MTTQEIEKQREIGKLLLLIEIIHQENDRVANSESKTFEKLIKYYANFMVDRIDGAIEMGYDWDVIQKMLRRELPYERFIYLKNEFSAC